MAKEYRCPGCDADFTDPRNGMERKVVMIEDIMIYDGSLDFIGSVEADEDYPIVCCTCKHDLTDYIEKNKL